MAVAKHEKQPARKGEKEGSLNKLAQCLNNWLALGKRPFARLANDPCLSACSLHDGMSARVPSGLTAMGFSLQQKSLIQLYVVLAMVGQEGCARKVAGTSRLPSNGVNSMPGLQPRLRNDQGAKYPHRQGEYDRDHCQEIGLFPRCFFSERSLDFGPRWVSTNHLERDKKT